MKFLWWWSAYVVRGDNVQNCHSQSRCAQTQNPYGLRMSGVQTQSDFRWACYGYSSVSRAVLRSLSLIWTRTCFQCRRKAVAFSKTRTTKAPFPIFSPPCISLCEPSTYSESGDMGEEKIIGGPTVSPPVVFSFLSLSQSVKKWTKNGEASSG